MHDKPTDVLHRRKNNFKFFDDRNLKFLKNLFVFTRHKIRFTMHFRTCHKVADLHGVVIVVALVVVATVVAARVVVVTAIRQKADP